MKLGTPDELRSFRESIVAQMDPQKLCVRICMTGCRAYGAVRIRDAFLKEIKGRGLEKEVEIRETGCHGFCARAPVITIDPKDIYYQQLTAGDVPENIDQT